MGVVGASGPQFGEQEPSLTTCSRGGAAPSQIPPLPMEGAEPYSSKKYAAPATSASCRRHSRQSGKNRSTSRQKAALWS